MKTFKKLLLSLMILSLPRLIQSAATINYFDDRVYSGVPAGTEPMLAFHGGSENAAIPFDLTYAGDLTAPEGTIVARHALNASAVTAYWGMVYTDGSAQQTPITRNLSAYAGGAIRFWVRSTVAHNMQIQIENGSGTKPTVSNIAVTTAWQEKVIPLSSFAGLTLSAIKSPFILLSTNASLRQNFFDHVRWTKPVTGLNIFPASGNAIAPGLREFTAEGVDGAGELVSIYPAWTKSDPSATFSVLKGRSTILTLGNVAGSVTATDEGTGLPVTANYLITAPNEEFGLLSETIVNRAQLGGPGQDSKLVVYSESTTVPPNPATLPLLSEESNPLNVREGVVSLKTELRAKTLPEDFQGWAIQWGPGLTPSIKNMSQYMNGSLRFWFKTGAANNQDLIDHLQVGIRSSNVTAGFETSKVRLASIDATAFNGQWHSIVIPMTLLAKAPPWADLSRTQVLFNISVSSVVGGTAASRTLYIDNLRWDTQKPVGALDTISVSPNPITVPFGVTRTFTAQGFDAFGAKMDINPTWTTTGGIGSVTPPSGPSTILTAVSAQTIGTVQATFGGKTGVSNVTVSNVSYTQALSIYTDAGSLGDVGVSTGPVAPTATQMGLKEISGGGITSDALTFRRSTYTLENSGPTLNDSYALWFAADPAERFLRSYANGYLHFYVRSTQDLEVSIRSGDQDPSLTPKIRLSELGIPLTGGTQWQEVFISLADMQARSPSLNFDRITTLFAIGALSSQIGEQPTIQTFDIDKVQWLTTSNSAPDKAKVYAGLKDKQHASGLVRSYENDNDAYLYDQALAAMAYTYQHENLTVTSAKSVFDVFKAKYDAKVSGGGFNGFEENVAVEAPNTIKDGTRAVGPNAWMLLALIHYRNVTDQIIYDDMIDGLANWIRSTQVTGGGAVPYGYRPDNTLRTEKSTEHNFDVYAVFKAYATLAAKRGNPAAATAFNGYAAQILTWVQTVAYNPAQARFNAGTQSNGTINPDKALDTYSWAPLVFSSYTHLLALAETEFGNSKQAVLTGATVTGFDFSGPFINPPQGNPPDKDAVWLEGTAQMAVAFYAIEHSAKGEFYAGELDKNVVDMITPGTQGLPYATNPGTAYGFIMDAENPAISSMAWYLFAKNKFNPFKPFPLNAVTVKSIAANLPATTVSWDAALPANWVRAKHYIQLDAQPVSIDAWGIQMYTDNKNPAYTPRFVDPTTDTDPNNILNHNLDSDPAGLLRLVPTLSTTSEKIPLAWSIKDSTTASLAPLASDPLTGPVGGQDDRFQWVFMQDAGTPAIDLDGDGSFTGPLDGLAFTSGGDVARVRNASGIHGSQGPAGYFPVLSPDFIYLEANFGFAATQVDYKTNIVLEFFKE